VARPLLGFGELQRDRADLGKGGVGIGAQRHRNSATIRG
jgi:hypothetical protein